MSKDDLLSRRRGLALPAAGQDQSLGFSNREGKPDGPVNLFYEREL